MKHLILLLLLSTLFFSGWTKGPSPFILDSDTLLQEQTVSSKLKIYPNPATTGQVTLEIQDHEIAEIRLINIAGREILQEKTDFGTNKYQLKLTDVPKGIYFLRVKTTENKVVAKKLIVSHR